MNLLIAFHKHTLTRSLVHGPSKRNKMNVTLKSVVFQETMLEHIFKLNQKFIRTLTRVRKEQRSLSYGRTLQIKSSSLYSLTIIDRYDTLTTTISKHTKWWRKDYFHRNNNLL
uniref:CSON006242 protein n=1 Tax=Culicoides sonorensis TaxID=179676 RepID=A0A336M806_CULSO